MQRHSPRSRRMLMKRPDTVLLAILVVHSLQIYPGHHLRMAVDHCTSAGCHLTAQHADIACLFRPRKAIYAVAVGLMIDEQVLYHPCLASVLVDHGQVKQRCSWLWLVSNMADGHRWCMTANRLCTSPPEVTHMWCIHTEPCCQTGDED